MEEKNLDANRKAEQLLKIIFGDGKPVQNKDDVSSDTHTQAEINEYLKQEKKLYIIKKKLENLQFEEEMILRTTFSKKMYWLIVVWLMVVLLILILNGFDSFFKLSDDIIITLLSTTTIQVLGLLWIVLRYLFKR